MLDERAVDIGLERGLADGRLTNVDQQRARAYALE
jgi:hypothetical protein